MKESSIARNVLMTCTNVPDAIDQSKESTWLSRNNDITTLASMFLCALSAENLLQLMRWWPLVNITMLIALHAQNVKEFFLPSSIIEKENQYVIHVWRKLRVSRRLDATNVIDLSMEPMYLTKVDHTMMSALDAISAIKDFQSMTSIVLEESQHALHVLPKMPRDYENHDIHILMIISMESC